LALQEIRWKVREWVNLTEERNKWLTAVNAQVPQNAVNFLTTRETIRF
jgi:hypothetical protein